MPLSHKCASCWRQTTNPTWCGVCVHASANRGARWLWFVVAWVLALFLTWVLFGPRASVTVAHGAPCPAGSRFVRTIDPGDGARAALRDVCQVER